MNPSRIQDFIVGGGRESAFRPPPTKIFVNDLRLDAFVTLEVMKQTCYIVNIRRNLNFYKY